MHLIKSCFQLVQYKSPSSKKSSSPHSPLTAVLSASLNIHGPQTLTTIDPFLLLSSYTAALISHHSLLTSTTTLDLSAGANHSPIPEADKESTISQYFPIPTISSSHLLTQFKHSISLTYYTNNNCIAFTVSFRHQERS
jgi:hypothetical protein